MTQTRSTCNHGRSCALKKRTTMRLAESCSKVHSTSCIARSVKHAILASPRNTEAHTGQVLPMRTSIIDRLQRLPSADLCTLKPSNSAMHLVLPLHYKNSHHQLPMRNPTPPTPLPPPRPVPPPNPHASHILAPMDCNGGLYAEDYV